MCGCSYRHRPQLRRQQSWICSDGLPDHFQKTFHSVLASAEPQKTVLSAFSASIKALSRLQVKGADLKKADSDTSAYHVKDDQSRRALALALAARLNGPCGRAVWITWYKCQSIEPEEVNVTLWSDTFWLLQRQLHWCKCIFVTWWAFGSQCVRS